LFFRDPEDNIIEIYAEYWPARPPLLLQEGISFGVARCRRWWEIVQPRPMLDYARRWIAVAPMSSVSSATGSSARTSP